MTGQPSSYATDLTTADHTSQKLATNRQKASMYNVYVYVNIFSLPSQCPEQEMLKNFDFGILCDQVLFSSSA